MLTRWFDSPTWPGFGSELSLLRTVLDDDLSALGRRLERALGQPLGHLAPRFDVKESEDGVTLRAALPGVSEKSLGITAQGSTLTVRGEQANTAPEGYKVLLRERTSARFQQSFTLSSDLDGSKTEARLEDGVLSIRIPKREIAQPRTIDVKVL